MIKISPKSAMCPISFKPKKVQIIMHHQGRLINQHDHSEFSNDPYLIPLRNRLNYIEIQVKELKELTTRDGLLIMMIFKRLE